MPTFSYKFGGDGYALKEHSIPAEKNLTFSKIPKDRVAVVFDFREYRDGNLRVCCQCDVYVLSTQDSFDSYMSDNRAIYLAPRGWRKNWNAD